MQYCELAEPISKRIRGLSVTFLSHCPFPSLLSRHCPHHEQSSLPVWLLTGSGRSGNALLPLALYWLVEVLSAMWPFCCGHVSVSWAIAVVTPAFHPPPSCTRSIILMALCLCHKTSCVQTHPRSRGMAPQLEEQS